MKAVELTGRGRDIFIAKSLNKKKRTKQEKRRRGVAALTGVVESNFLEEHGLDVLLLLVVLKHERLKLDVVLVQHLLNGAHRQQAEPVGHLRVTLRRVQDLQGGPKRAV